MKASLTALLPGIDVLVVGYIIAIKVQPILGAGPVGGGLVGRLQVLGGQVGGQEGGGRDQRGG